MWFLQLPFFVRWDQLSEWIQSNQQTSEKMNWGFSWQACVSGHYLQSCFPSDWASLSPWGRMLTGIRQWPLHGFIRKRSGYSSDVERADHSHVSDFSILMELRKYCGFSMTGIFVIPMITASGPISEDVGVLLPLETWWRGLAESSSLLMTEEEPGEPQRRWRNRRRVKQWDESRE